MQGCNEDSRSRNDNHDIQIKIVPSILTSSLAVDNTRSEKQTENYSGREKEIMFHVAKKFPVYESESVCAMLTMKAY
jgi:UDP-N-acetylglucosamine pyrophosphorylase